MARCLGSVVRPGAVIKQFHDRTPMCCDDAHEYDYNDGRLCLGAASRGASARATAGSMLRAGGGGEGGWRRVVVMKPRVQ